MGRFHLSEVVVQFLGFKNAEHGSRVIYDLYEKFPEIRAEFKDTHLLWLSPSASRQIHSKMPFGVEDFMKVIPPRGSSIKALEEFPVTMAGPMSICLEGGTLDADLHLETAIS
jgi:hypothetical protein